MYKCLLKMHKSEKNVNDGFFLMWDFFCIGRHDRYDRMMK